MCAIGFFFPSYIFSAASEANNTASCTVFDELLHWCDCDFKDYHIHQCFRFALLPVISLRSTVWRSSLFLIRSQSRLRWTSFWHLPSVPLLFTLLNVCACERVCVCHSEPVCVCLIKPCLATLIAADASESITIPPSQTSLHLHSLGLVWRISQVGEYIFRVSLL